uniref:SFRICE_039405 n=1 Tax=Spodoptera frugiperda TaxID=7108 RepID=A0A2H1WD78_SPOFR
MGLETAQCAEPQEAGSCDNKEALWSFSVSENRCVPFYFSGCGGNNNRFPSREACEQTCPAAYVPDKCTLPAETGQCFNYRERWFFDTTFKK